MNSFDLVIMLTKGNLELFKKILPFYKTNISPKQIYVVAANDICCDIENLDVCFIDEASLYAGLTIDHIADIIEEISGRRERAGWYLQQFLKMAWSYRCEDKGYVVIDADTVPLNRLDFISAEGKYLLTQKIEYNEPYFETIKALFNGNVIRQGKFSFIAENMIFDCACVKELISDIESNSQLKGEKFYEKILYAINPKDLLASGFSEFETYGNYMLTYYPEKIQMRTLRTFRESVVILGKNPSYEQLVWAQKDYDIISIEVLKYRNTLLTRLSEHQLFRKYCKFSLLVQVYIKIRSLYRNILGKQDIRYD